MDSGPIRAFEAYSKGSWFEGNFHDCEGDKKKRHGPNAVMPHPITCNTLERR